MGLTGNTIFISGGTSGIGRALAEEFHKLGHKVVIAGRRQPLLDEITALNPGMTGITLDVGDPSSVDTVATQIAAEFPDLDVLVNNAGISAAEDLVSADGDTSMSREIIRTNILGTLDMTAAFLPVLMRRPRATLITTTSGLAFVPRAAYPSYCASKAFLHSWIQSLRHQLHGTPVEVLELAPPYVQTELAGAAQAQDPRAMPLSDYVAEVMRLLSGPRPPSGEILVERVRHLREAETKGAYDEVFSSLNPR